MIQVLAFLSLLGLARTSASISLPSELHTITRRADSGLNGHFKACGKKFWGTAADPGTLAVAAITNIIKAEFGQITPEKSMQWSATEATRGTFTFDASDQVVNFAVSNGKLIRGQTLIWHASLPPWVASITDKNTLTSVIQTHIRAVAGRYKAKLYSWDVVNEVLLENGSLRSSVFSDVLGESFITLAFTEARAADPAARLFINEYNIDSDNAKTRGLVSLVKRINQSNQLINGIGSQMHLNAGQVSSISAGFNILSGAGLELAITELDIAGASESDYLIVTSVCRNTALCVSMTSWGVSDNTSSRAASKPLLFDSQYLPKPAYTTVVNYLKQ